MIQPVIKMSVEEWEAKFKPVNNHLDDNASWSDDEVFFYCEGGEEELKSLVGNNGEDFNVLSYDIDYKIPLVLADMEVEQ